LSRHRCTPWMKVSPRARCQFAFDVDADADTDTDAVRLMPCRHIKQGEAVADAVATTEA
jgi:hypothetical protein